MSLTSPVSCVSDAFIYITFLDFGFAVFSVISRIRFFLLLDFLHLISSDESDSLDDEYDDVCFSFFDFTITLVVPVSWVLEFWFQ